MTIEQVCQSAIEIEARIVARHDADVKEVIVVDIAFDRDQAASLGVIGRRRKRRHQELNQLVIGCQ